MTSNVALSALLLLALAGGFVFANDWKRTRYRISRAQGQQIYFYAALYGVLLLFLSFLLFWVASSAIPDPWEAWIGEAWASFLAPLEAPALPRFLGAFVLGWLGAKFLNRISDDKKTARVVIDEHGSQLEQFLYDAILDAQLLFVAFDNRKVYVGWATLQPKLKPRPDSDTEYFGLLPVRSGYLDETTLKPRFTTEYGPVYQRIIEGTIENLSMADFDILLPMDKVTVIRPYSLDLPPEEFAMSPEESGETESAPAKANGSGWFTVLIGLLIGWAFARRSKSS